MDGSISLELVVVASAVRLVLSTPSACPDSGIMMDGLKFYSGFSVASYLGLSPKPETLYW